MEEVSPPEVIGRGPHHRVIQRVVAEPGPDGQRRPRVSRYTELATGLHRAVEDGQGGVTWVETEEKFELVPGGAVARGQHTVRINGDFLAGAVVDLELGGHRFRSRLLGLALTDVSSGQSVLIAEPQACEGELTAPNVILFRDALAGPVRCDVRFTFTRAGFAQDVICRTRVPDPKDLGLDPVWTRIEVWTVLDASEPTGRETRLAKPEEAGLPMLDAGMSDETVHWGALRLGPGRAFLLGEEESDEIVVAKDIVDLQQTRFLIEKIDYVDVEDELRQLPLAAVPPAGAARPAQARVRAGSRRAALTAALRRDQDRRERAQAGVGPPGRATRTFAVASAVPPAATAREPGLVLDYQLINVNTNAVVFQKAQSAERGTLPFSSATIKMAGLTSPSAQANA